MTILDESTVRPIMYAFAEMADRQEKEENTDGFTSHPDTDAYYPGMPEEEKE